MLSPKPLTVLRDFTESGQNTKEQDQAKHINIINSLVTMQIHK